MKTSRPPSRVLTQTCTETCSRFTLCCLKNTRGEAVDTCVPLSIRLWRRHGLVSMSSVSSVSSVSSMSPTAACPAGLSCPPGVQLSSQLSSALLAHMLLC